MLQADKAIDILIKLYEDQYKVKVDYKLKGAKHGGTDCSCARA